MNDLPWSSGSLSGRGEPRVIFGFQHEDASIEVGVFEKGGGGRVLCVASGGETAFALLAAGAAEVVAVDANPAQLHLVESKLAAIREVKMEWMRSDASEILSLGELADKTTGYWKRHRASLKHGLCFSGTVEHRARRLGPILRWVASKPGGIRWRTGCLLVQCFVALGYAAVFRAALPRGWCLRLCERIGKTAKASSAHPLWLAELGLGFGQSGLPVYRTESVARLRGNLERLKLVPSDLESFLEEKTEERWNLVVLSNIADTMTLDRRESLLRIVTSRLRPGGSLIIRSIVSDPASLPPIKGLEWRPLPKDAGPICPVIGVGTLRINEG